MLKLYKNEDGKLNYWETWDADANTSVVYFGVVGTLGETIEYRSLPDKDFHDEIQSIVDEKLADGYLPLPRDVRFTLLIYPVLGHGTIQDLDKRHALELRMNETLGWTGLGNCDGGSIGSGTMEVCCFVVDFEIAKQVIEEDLAGTEFVNYSRIYDENDTTPR